MIFVKDGITRETLMAVLAYSESDDCKFRLAIKPPTNISNDWVFYKTSVVSFQKIEEEVQKLDSADPKDPERFQRRFNVRVVVEDGYYVPFEPTEENDRRHSRITPVPAAVINRVSEILNTPDVSRASAA